MIVDPVCGKVLTEREAKAAAFYNGRIYYFCSTEHRDMFNAGPTFSNPWFGKFFVFRN